MLVRETDDPADPGWLLLRAEFFPEDRSGEHRRFLEAAARGGKGFHAFVAEDGRGKPLGFAEVAVRTDFVNGCRYRPVLYLEGIYVRPEARRRGIAHALCSAAGAWGRERGCREFASDVYPDDADSLAAHAALGFEETERVVYFRKELDPGSAAEEDAEHREE